MVVDDFNVERASERRLNGKVTVVAGVDCQSFAPGNLSRCY